MYLIMLSRHKFKMGVRREVMVRQGDSWGPGPMVGTWSCGGDGHLQSVSWLQLNHSLTARAFPHLQESSHGCCFTKQCSLRDNLLTAWAFPHLQESLFGCCFNKPQKRIINITSKIFPYIVQAEEKGLI